MPRQKTQQNPDKTCKIRKRVSSSSSCSSLVKHYRFKRAILVGKRVGSSTPVPSWKVMMASGSRSPVQKLKNFEINGVTSNNRNRKHQIRGKEGFSARKLGATLWEINGLHSPAGEKIDGSKVGGQRRRSSATSQRLDITEYIPREEGFETTANFSSIEVRENNSIFKTRLKDVNNSLVASKELVKVLFRIFPHEEQNSSRITLVSALRAELDRSRHQIDQMIQQQRYNSNEIDSLLKSFAEEKAAWKIKEKERIREVETERKLRRQAERLNKKLGIELANLRANLSKTMKELEVEKREKEILEQTCEDMEKERQMLKLADVLREERVQMKLTDAKYEYEEKNAALDRLKTELEIYFNNQESSDKENGDNVLSNFDSKSGIIHKTQLGSFRNLEKEDFGESELHTIEISTDNKNNEEPRRGSIDEVFKGRKSLSEKVQWENICLQRTTNSDGIEWEFGVKKNGNIIRTYSQGSASESPTISTGKSSCLREACNAILLDLASRRANG